MGNSRSTTLVGLLHGPDQRGLVARVAGWIFERGGNIIHADQHHDAEAKVFFQRVEWMSAGDPRGEADAFDAFARGLGMNVRVAPSDRRGRVAVLVSKNDHCFHDLVLRWRAGEFNGDMVCVISNHPDVEAASQAAGLPFYHVPVDAANRPKAERRMLEVCRDHKADLAVLARYMQILSVDFLEAFGSPVINIHHSFLPAFAGGRPYHQAHERGVKLVGATAHYATAILDDGPIIHQDVVRVTHRHGVSDLVRKGRDLEKMVLAQAVRWHLEHRILVYGKKTVVFD